jgi:hypothetical protein
VRTPRRRPLAFAVTAAAAAGLTVAASVASAAPAPARVTHHVVQPVVSSKVNAAQSSNWFGYNKPLFPDRKLFSRVAGDWNVPAATQHTPGEAENSSTWIGIGGGCVALNCLVTDTTLIQTGTEQDVDANGNPSYSAWYELIPAPELRITTMTIHAGDHMHARIFKKLGGLWDITLSDVTTGQTFHTTVPYTSTQGSAEWITETPLLIAGAQFAALPNLSRVNFFGVSVNGHNAQLKTSEQMQLVNANGQVYGAPSNPGSGGNSFSDCAWASTC